MFEYFQLSALLPFIIAFLTSLGLCCLIAFAPHLFLKSEHMENDLNARQAQHKRPTPRIGGVAVILATVVAGGLYAESLKSDLLLALGAGSVVFLVGLREDISRDMSPKARLLAAFASAALAIVLSGVVLPRLGIGYIDNVVGIFAVGVLLTLIWSAGACHALNLIDGLNGLSSGYSIIAAVAYAVIASITGDADVQLTSLILAAALLGFFVMNWPFGRVFLGDAGAYAIGHILAWLGLVLLSRNPEGAGLAALLILFWPVADTAFAIVRRRLLDKDTDQPDRLHFHHLVVRALRLSLGKKLPPDLVNPAAAMVLQPFIALPIAFGVLTWSNGLLALTALLFFAFLFVSTYVFSVDYFRARKFSLGELPETVQERLRNYKLEVSPLSGIVVTDSHATDLKICRRAGHPKWSILALDSSGEEISIFDRFETEQDAWEHFQAIGTDT